MSGAVICDKKLPRLTTRVTVSAIGDRRRHGGPVLGAVGRGDGDRGRGGSVNQLMSSAPEDLEKLAGMD
jgi:hypothetical protein